VSGRRKLYGIKEIADEIDQRRQTVAQWYRREKLPPPTEVLSMGPVWTAEAIKQFIRDEKKRSK
jgi:hypothetical protein